MNVNTLLQWLIELGDSHFTGPISGLVWKWVKAWILSENSAIATAFAAIPGAGVGDLIGIIVNMGDKFFLGTANKIDDFFWGIVKAWLLGDAQAAVVARSLQQPC